MFKKQGFFNKQSHVLQGNVEENIVSKFKELELDEVDQSIIVQRISVNIHTILNNKTASSPFNNQIIKYPVNHVAPVVKIKLISKQIILFPESSKSSKRCTLQPQNKFSKFIQPFNLEILLKWKLYSEKPYKFDIDEIISKYAKMLEIKKLIPNKYALGNDIVPQYLLKGSKKSKTNKSDSKSKISVKSILKDYKNFKGYLPNETNLSLIGFPKSGKSTILASLLLHLEYFDKDFIKKTQWEATKLNSVESKTAWLIDCSNDERYFKETISSSSHYVEVVDKSFNIIDCPGNMCYYVEIIKGLIASDYVMLTINLDNDWCPNSLEFNKSEYLDFLFHLFKVFSIDKVLIILVNSLNFDVKFPLSKIHTMWKKMFKTKLNYVCIKNLSNIQTAEIQSIIKQISDFQIESREKSAEIEKPLLLEIIDIFKPIESNLPVIVGSVIRGGISSGLNNPSSKVLISPENITSTVKSLKIQEKDRLVTRTSAFPGHKIEITLPEVTSVDTIKIGSYISHPGYPMIVNQHFRVQMMIFDCNISVPIINGIKIFLWSKSRSCFCELTKMISVEYFENKKKVIQKSPRLIQNSGCILTAHMTTEELLAVEFNSEYKLDIFFLFSQLKLFAAGKFIDLF